jgi:RNase adapter protein RapZ
LDGNDQRVATFFQSHPIVTHFISQTATYLTEWLPIIERHHRHYLTVAIDCTGGRHRSVYVTNQLAAHFQRVGKRVQVHHTVLEQKASIE